MTPTLSVQRLTKAWFNLKDASGKPDGSETPVLLTPTLGRNGPGSVTWTAALFDGVSGAALGPATVEWATVDGVSYWRVNVGAAVLTYGQQFGPGHKVYVTASGTDSTDPDPGPQLQFDAFLQENG